MLIITYILMLQIKNAYSCVNGFESYGGICFSLLNPKADFLQSLKLCYSRNAHLVMIDELNSIPLNVLHYKHTYLATHNLFTSVETTKYEWFNPAEGKVQAIEAAHWMKNRPTGDSWAKSLSVTSEGEVFDTNEKYGLNSFCIHDDAKPIYPNRLNRLILISENSWPTLQPPANIFNNRISMPREILFTPHKLTCLVKCIRDRACKSVYFSKTKKSCVLMLYIDAPINSADINGATDFKRYSIAIASSFD